MSRYARLYSPSHGENRGSISLGSANQINGLIALSGGSLFRYGNYTENTFPNGDEHGCTVSSFHSCLAELFNTIFERRWGRRAVLLL